MVRGLRGARRSRTTVGAFVVFLAGSLAGLSLVWSVNSSQAAAAFPPEGGVHGSHPLLTLLCKYADVPEEPQPVDYFRSLLTDSRNSLDSYWREVSYGMVDLRGSEAYGWYGLPHSRDYYLKPGAETPRLNRLAQDCASAADPDVDYSRFAGLNLVFNDCVDRPRGGVVTLRLEDSRRRVTTTWACTGWGSTHRILAHEIGHSFGLPHSRSASGDEYGNPWDIQSGEACCAYDRRFGVLAQQPIAYAKDLLGWIPAEHKLVVPRSAVFVAELQALGDASLIEDTYVMLRIPLGGNDRRFYTVEARCRSGWDRGLAGDAVVIHLVDPRRTGAPARLVVPPGDWEASPLAGAWLPGMVFTDADHGISVEVLDGTRHGFRVAVTTGA